MWVVQDDTEDSLVAVCTTKELAISITKSYLERVDSDCYRDTLDREERGTDIIACFEAVDVRVFEIQTDKDLTKDE